LRWNQRTCKWWSNQICNARWNV